MNWGRGWHRSFGKAAIVCGAVLLAGSPAVGTGAAEPAPCPPGLEKAAAEFGSSMQSEQHAVRDSRKGDTVGVEETVQFDLAAHACHRGPGQAYRSYGEPRCLPADEQGRVAVRYPYDLFFRKALTLERLFEKQWQAGSPGAEQVTFEREEGRWIPVGRKDVLISLEREREAPSHHGRND